MRQVIDSVQCFIEIYCVPEYPRTLPHYPLEMCPNLCRILASRKECRKKILLMFYLFIIYFFYPFFRFTCKFTRPFSEDLCISKGISPKTVCPVNPPGDFAAGK